MTFLLLLPTILSFLLMAAHFLFHFNLFLTVMSLVLTLLLFVRTRYVLRAMQALLILMCIEWVFTAIDLVQTRIAEHNPDVIPPGIILGGIAAFNLLAAALLQARRVKARYPRETDASPQAAAESLHDPGL